MSSKRSSSEQQEAVAQAKARLAELPDGTYTLKDIAVRWPDLLPAALEVVGEAMARPRKTSFHSVNGVVEVERPGSSKETQPRIDHRRGEDVTITIRAGAVPAVIMGRPSRKG